MPKKEKPEVQRAIFIAISIIALGITITTIYEKIRPVGVVMIAIGGILLIIGMKRKKDEENKNK